MSRGWAGGTLHPCGSLQWEGVQIDHETLLSFHARLCAEWRDCRHTAGTRVRQGAGERALPTLAIHKRLLPDRASGLGTWSSPPLTCLTPAQSPSHYLLNTAGGAVRGCDQHRGVSHLPHHPLRCAPQRGVRDRRGLNKGGRCGCRCRHWQCRGRREGFLLVLVGESSSWGEQSSQCPL